jgi:hypothetical protein
MGDGEGKEYVFVWGGPYDPDDEIQSSFNNLSRVRDVIQQFSKGIEEELVRRFPV